MSKKNKIKLLIPNILTIARLVLIPFIIGFGITKHFKIVVILTIIASITDFLDGKLARCFHTTSELGAKLDSFSDKVFAISISMAIAVRCGSIIPIIFLEIVIAVTNFYYYRKTGLAKSLMIGKIKTFALFTTIILTYSSILIKGTLFNKFLIGVTYATFNLQVLSLISYVYYHINLEDEKEENKEVNENLEKTILVDSIEDLRYKKDYDNDII